MLEDLPTEVLQIIIGHLPTISAITSLARTSKKLHTLISSDEPTVYKTFVKRSFPTISTPPTWREAAESLTSRSRAWDRRALVVRECCPPETLQLSWNPPQGRQNASWYSPALDSYDDFSSGNSLSNRRETVAWGAAGRIYIRGTDRSSRKWRTIKFDDDEVATNDILQLKLLRPHQKTSDAETLVYRRANGEMATLETADNDAGFHQFACFTGTHREQRMAVSDDTSPLLAVSSSVRLNVYKVHTAKTHIKPLEVINLRRGSPLDHRARSVKFLNSSHIALGTACHEGLSVPCSDHDPIKVYDVNASLGDDNMAVPIWTCRPKANPDGSWSRQFPHVITPLDHVNGNSGQLFLSGWNGGHARLHDIRSPSPWVNEWIDTVDTGHILSLATIGHERFLAGSDQNGCLKTFDLRHPGEHTYSYLNARPPQVKPHQQSPTAQKSAFTIPNTFPRDFNTFLSIRRWRWESLWTSLPLPLTHHNTTLYSGPIYSLTIPSPTSPTIYAGIENHVLQIDLAATDDIERNQLDPLLSSLATEKSTHVFDIACYERPRRGKESTDPVLLNKQAVWHELRGQPERNRESEERGWDRRWRLGENRRSSWGRGGGRQGQGHARGGRRGSNAGAGGGGGRRWS